MLKVFSPNKTSAKLFIDFAQKKWGDPEHTEIAEELEQRYLLLYDIYIKARSYALINKFAFWLSILGGMMVFIWPSIAIIFKDFGFEKEFLRSAIVQTTVTALSALFFAIYSHYKKRQLYFENLMRLVVFSNEKTTDLTDRILKEVERLDTGFSFSKTVIQKEQEKEP